MIANVVWDLKWFVTLDCHEKDANKDTIKEKTTKPLE